MTLANFEYGIVPHTVLARRFGIKSSNTLYSINDGLSYKDYALEYSKLTNE